MKKTIITLLALAGVAAHGAETLTTLDSDLLKVADVRVGSSTGSDNLDATNNVLAWDTTLVSPASTNYILTFSFNQLRAGDVDAFLRLGGGDGYGLATQGTDGDTMKLATSRTDVTGEAFSINTSDTYALTIATIDNVGYAIISNLTTHTSQEINNISAESYKITSGTSKVWTNTSGDDKIRLTVGEIADLSGLSLSQIREVATTGSYTIPEPTTATLSLLALAGLAARRRRASR